LSRHGTLLLAALLAALLALCTACSGVEVPTPLVRPSQLDATLQGSQIPAGPLDDHWTLTLGDYLSPAELGSYWLSPNEERFTRWGDRWLEYSLREELLAPSKDELTPDELERFRSQPDYESSKRVLDEIHGAREDR
jgi:hypothetical protein